MKLMYLKIIFSFGALTPIASGFINNMAIYLSNTAKESIKICNLILDDLNNRLWFYKLKHEIYKNDILTQYFNIDYVFEKLRTDVDRYSKEDERYIALKNTKKALDDVYYILESYDVKNITEKIHICFKVIKEMEETLKLKENIPTRLDTNWKRWEKKKFLKL
uniref:Uncharacterized protein n=1 Tax=Clastoptera arizonana TaxID=38151 RepID=A0A1B6CKE0_9HEMI